MIAKNKSHIYRSSMIQKIFEEVMALNYKRIEMLIIQNTLMASSGHYKPNSN
jgi:hypothetical protein